MKPFHLIGVIDLLRGRAVHARGGKRAEYRHVEAAAGAVVAGDPTVLARIYLQKLSLENIYVADLDAIAGGTPQDGLVASIARLGASLWLDAGISSVGDAAHALTSGVRRVVVGLETLQSLEQLRAIASAIGPERVAFSLDLCGGVPMIAADAAIARRPPAELAAAAADAGSSAVIVLDLERVGGCGGVDLPLLETIRDAAPNVLLFAGGGVRGPDDLSRLVEVGCDGALVATALHSGAIDPRAPAGAYRSR